jgi:hypothetical protein
VVADYRRVATALTAVRKLRDRLPARAPAARPPFTDAAIARGFAWMFSGARLPAPRLFDLVLGNGG